MKFTGGNKVEFDLREYKTFKELLNEAQRKQDEFNVILDALSRYPPREKKKVKNELLRNSENAYKGIEKIIEGFETGIFSLITEDFHSDGQRSDSPATSDPSTDESYGLTERDLQMLKRLFKYNNDEEWKEDLMRADTEENYDELLNDINIKQTVLKDQIKITTGISRTRIENLVNDVEDVLDKVRAYDNIFDQRTTESSNQEGLTSNQMLSRLPIL